MENDKLKASCPVCGRGLFRGTEKSYIDGYCPKCGSHIEVEFFASGVKSSVIYEDNDKVENRPNHK